MNILVRCKSTVDNNCYGGNNTFTTDPIKCTNNNPLCTLSPTIYIDPCNNNNTDFTNSDDFFTIQASATIQGGNHPQRFEVVVGADPFTGLGGNVLNSGGTVYNSTILLGQNKIFKADGTITLQTDCQRFDQQLLLYRSHSKCNCTLLRN